MKVRLVCVLFLGIALELGCGGGGSGSGDAGPDAIDASTIDAAPALSVCLDTVSSRGPHTCAITGSGQGVCWGKNHRGQLGIDSTMDNPSPTAVMMPGDITIDEIGTGIAHTCARAGGNIYCWGYNGDGAVGDNTRINTPLPKQVMVIDDAQKLIVGGFTNCAIRANDSLWCWGDNLAGQIGNGLMGDNDALVPVEIGQNIAAAAAGEEHTCSVALSGVLECWGRNEEGQLGVGTTDPHPLPNSVETGGGVPINTASMVWAGAYHTCAVIGGAIHCWGQNGDGEIAGTAGANQLNPVVLGDIPGNSTIVAGEAHTCALNAGQVTCWGSNEVGQLGQGDTNPRAGLSIVPGISTATSIASGDRHVCVVDDNEARCWGDNSNGQLGTGNFAGTSSPVDSAVTCTQ